MKESYVSYEQARKLKELGLPLEWTNGVQYIKKLPDTEREIWEAYCYDTTLPPLMGADTLDPLFDSYESALSAGIDAAIKILEEKGD